MFDTVSGMISAVAQDGFYIVQEFNVDDPTDLITVVDLPNRQVLQCEARHLVPVDTKWCPENQALGRRDETSGQIFLDTKFRISGFWEFRNWPNWWKVGSQRPRALSAWCSIFSETF